MVDAATITVDGLGGIVSDATLVQAGLGDGDSLVVSNAFSLRVSGYSLQNVVIRDCSLLQLTVRDLSIALTINFQAVSMPPGLTEFTNIAIAQRNNHVPHGYFNFAGVTFPSSSTLRMVNVDVAREVIHNLPIRPDVALIAFDAACVIGDGVTHEYDGCTLTGAGNRASRAAGIDYRPTMVVGNGFTLRVLPTNDGTLSAAVTAHAPGGTVSVDVAAASKGRGLIISGPASQVTANLGAAALGSFAVKTEVLAANLAGTSIGVATITATQQATFHLADGAATSIQLIGNDHLSADVSIQRVTASGDVLLAGLGKLHLTDLAAEKVVLAKSRFTNFNVAELTLSGRGINIQDAVMTPGLTTVEGVTIGPHNHYSPYAFFEFDNVTFPNNSRMLIRDTTITRIIPHNSPVRADISLIGFNAVCVIGDNVTHEYDDVGLFTEGTARNRAAGIDYRPAITVGANFSMSVPGGMRGNVATSVAAISSGGDMVACANTAIRGGGRGVSLTGAGKLNMTVHGAGLGGITLDAKEMYITVSASSVPDVALTVSRRASIRLEAVTGSTLQIVGPVGGPRPTVDLIIKSCTFSSQMLFKGIDFNVFYVEGCTSDSFIVQDASLERARASAMRMTTVLKFVATRMPPGHFEISDVVIGDTSTYREYALLAFVGATFPAGSSMAIRRTNITRTRHHNHAAPAEGMSGIGFGTGTVIASNVRLELEKIMIEAIGTHGGASMMRGVDWRPGITIDSSYRVTLLGNMSGNRGDSYVDNGNAVTRSQVTVPMCCGTNLADFVQAVAAVLQTGGFQCAPRRLTNSLSLSRLPTGTSTASVPPTGTSTATQLATPTMSLAATRTVNTSTDTITLPPTVTPSVGTPSFSISHRASPSVSANADASATNTNGESTPSESSSPPTPSASVVAVAPSRTRTAVEELVRQARDSALEPFAIVNVPRAAYSAAGVLSGILLPSSANKPMSNMRVLQLVRVCLVAGEEAAVLESPPGEFPSDYAVIIARWQLGAGGGYAARGRGAGSAAAVVVVLGALGALTLRAALTSRLSGVEPPTEAQPLPVIFAMLTGYVVPSAIEAAAFAATSGAAAISGTVGFGGLAALLAVSIPVWATSVGVESELEKASVGSARARIARYMFPLIIDGLSDETKTPYRAHALLDYSVACVVAVVVGATKGGVRFGDNCVVAAATVALAAVILAGYYAVLRPFTAKLDVGVTCAQSGTLALLCIFTFGAVYSEGTVVTGTMLGYAAMAAELVSFGAPLVLLVPTIQEKFCSPPPDGNKMEKPQPASSASVSSDPLRLDNDDGGGGGGGFGSAAQPLLVAPPPDPANAVTSGSTAAMVVATGGDRENFEAPLPQQQHSRNPLNLSRPVGGRSHERHDDTRCTALSPPSAVYASHDDDNHGGYGGAGMATARGDEGSFLDDNDDGLSDRPSTAADGSAASPTGSSLPWDTSPHRGRDDVFCFRGRETPAYSPNARRAIPPVFFLDAGGGGGGMDHHHHHHRQQRQRRQKDILRTSSDLRKPKKKTSSKHDERRGSSGRRSTSSSPRRDPSLPNPLALARRAEREDFERQRRDERRDEEARAVNDVTV